MSVPDVDSASNDDHLVLGTVNGLGDGWLLIEVDHCETAPKKGQRVKVLADDTGKPTGDDDA